MFLLNLLLISYMSNTETRELRLLGLLPMTGEGWTGGGACLTAVQMALEDINAMERILVDYNLTYNWIDSKVSEFYCACV